MKETGFLDRLRAGLSRTRDVLNMPVEDLVRGRRPLDASSLESIEEALLGADLGLPAVAEAMSVLRARSGEIAAGGIEAMREALRAELCRQLDKASPVVPFSSRPWVVFVVGVNGAGKTTTIGKLGQRLKAEGKSVVLAAGDTFRAAAVEQLTSWGQRNDIPVISQQQGSDSASVVFDAVRSGQARGADVVLADTAGRLQAKTNLMEELAKIKRVVSKLDASAPHSVLLVLDGSVGQNALSQVKEFDAAVGLTGLIVTKLDGTAKAGVLFAIANTSRLPVHFVGVGEAVEDLRPFEPESFVDALLARDPD